MVSWMFKFCAKFKLYERLCAYALETPVVGTMSKKVKRERRPCNESTYTITLEDINTDSIEWLKERRYPVLCKILQRCLQHLNHTMAQAPRGAIACFN
jgi:hypothetical protein